MKKVHYGVWCDSLMAFYSAAPIVNALYNKSPDVIIFCLKKDEAAIKATGSVPAGVQYKLIDVFDSGHLRKLNWIFVNILTSRRFSKMFKRNQIKRFGLIFEKLVDYFPKFSEINVSYSKFFGPLSPELPVRVLYSLSRVKYPYLICSPKIQHIQVMESWDHPVKAPYYHSVDAILTWNQDLISDYRAFQGKFSGHYGIIRPIKFEYIKKYASYKNSILKAKLTRKHFIEEIDWMLENRPITYISTTSSENKFQHVGELCLIEHLCEVTKKLGVPLYIKPKPNGAHGDYEYLSERYAHVRVGPYARNVNAIDMLDDEYHLFRYLQIKTSSLIVNVATTFVLESALAGAPILQLELEERVYGMFALYKENYHIKKYLIERGAQFVDGPESLKDSLKEIERHISFSDSLRNWIEK